ncbi:MAG: TRAP transporter fused permease subunit [Acetobacterales bacterium]
MSDIAPPGVPRDVEGGELTSGWRLEQPILRQAITAASILVALIHVWFNTLGTVSEIYAASLHFGMFGALCALYFPVNPGATGTFARGAGLVFDLLVAGLALACGIYVVFMVEPLFDRGVHFVTTDWIFAIIAIVLAVEFVRRTTGMIIPVLIILSVTYMAWWGRYVDGVFHFPGLSLEVVLFRAYFGDDGLFGPIAYISVTYVFMFILFGAFLVRSGAGDFIVDLARLAAGRMIGGPGLVAVFGSALMGSISGSAVANVVTTGVITIPMMKKAGFEPKFAAGVESAASTGGQIMPPIMGAGAFIMASFTQISYLTIVAVSLLPALLYFLSVAFWVRIEAKRLGLGIMHDEDAPGLAEVMRRGGHSLIPIGVLVGMLIAGYTPTYAAGVSIATAVAASWISPGHRMGPRAIAEAMTIGARNMTATAVLLVGVGLVVGVFGTTGLGNTISLMITQWAGNNLLLTLVLVALASLVLGMGLPVTASYIVLATLSAPALYELISHSQLVQAIAGGQIGDTSKAVLMLVAPDRVAGLGQPMSAADATALLAQVPPEMLATIRDELLSPAVLTTALLSAHMIIFWLSQDSNVTPPVCLVAFAAAAIARTPPMATGMTAWKVAKGLYICPVLFAYTPFLGGDWLVALEIFGFATLGIYALSASIAGFWEHPLALPFRVTVGTAGVLLLWPNTPMLNLVAAGVLVVAILTSRWMQRAAERPAA